MSADVSRNQRSRAPVILLANLGSTANELTLPDGARGDRSWRHAVSTRPGFAERVPAGQTLMVPPDAAVFYVGEEEAGTG